MGWDQRSEDGVHDAKIVTFANQKGGVGKSTLCKAFANYLLTKGARVAVADCDSQLSTYHARQMDLEKYDGTGFEEPYDILTADAADEEDTCRLIGDMHRDALVDVFLADTPGSLEAAGMPLLLVNSDFVVIPFQYEAYSLASTLEFLGIVLQLMDMRDEGAGDRAGRGTAGRLYFVPNMKVERMGKPEERAAWRKADEMMRRYGTLTASVAHRADMQRFSTIADLDSNLPLVEKAFGTIYEGIFGTGGPIREEAPAVRRNRAHAGRGRGTASPRRKIPEAGESVAGPGGNPGIAGMMRRGVKRLFARRRDEDADGAGRSRLT